MVLRSEISWRLALTSSRIGFSQSGSPPALSLQSSKHCEGVDMRAHIYMRFGFWIARIEGDLCLPFRTFEGACRWARRIHEGN